MRRNLNVSAQNEGSEKQKLACAGGEEETEKGFIWLTVIKSVGRILAYHLDGTRNRKKENLPAVTMANFTFSLFAFHTAVR